MTIDADWAEEGYEAELEEEEAIEQTLTEGVVVPVKVVFDENQRLSPTFCSCMTYTVQQVGTAGVIVNQLQILPRRLKRYKAKFIVNFPAAGTLTLNTRGDSLTNPTPTGFNLVAAAAGNVPLPEYDAMQPMYAIGSIAGITISVFDESYGNVAAGA